MGRACRFGLLVPLLVGCGTSGSIQMIGQMNGSTGASAATTAAGSAGTTTGMAATATAGSTTAGASSSIAGTSASTSSGPTGGHGASTTGSTTIGASSSGTTGTPTSSSTSGSTGTRGSTTSGGLLPDAGPVGYTLIFDDEFDTLSLMAPRACFGGASPTVCDGGGTWLPTYTWNNRTLSSNDEAEIYVDSTYAGSGAGCTTPLGLNPFLLDAGILTLQANPSPAADLACLSNLPYTSGTIVSYPSFATTYGYFEARIKLPAGQGLWPAFWLLDENLQWPPEIDIFEFVDIDGGQPSTLQMHTHDSNTTYAFGTSTQVPNVAAGFHVYAVDWEPDTITWYFDGVQQAQTTTAPDLNQPMYILLNLAVGGPGSWPGACDSSTVFPANMQIDWVRVWQKQ